MLFNSIEFAIFLPIVFLLYWFVTNKNLKLQNAFLILASYFFYGWWDWRFLSLIIFSSSVDYLIGIALSKQGDAKKRKLLLLASIAVNIGFLAFFKYFNFFADSFASAFTLLGVPFEPTRLNIILPVGISFYTFQTLSYTIDVYRRKLEPTKDALSFYAFVSFFPQLVAGPIERATNLLPQFYKKRQFDHEKAVDGMRQILWGLFKKMVIADNCAVYVNAVFANPSDYPASTLLLGAIFFAFQIYGDFSGYSDIAIGTSRLFGFNLMRNFAYPYFSRDIAEFWRRWHISLSTWFRDYVYIPIGGSRVGNWKKIRNVFIIFIVSGFWHGANWTFIIWGALNAIYFLPLLLMKSNRSNLDVVAQNSFFPNLKEILQVGTTFTLTTLAWVFFRSASVSDAIQYLIRIFSPSLFVYPKNVYGFPQHEVITILGLFIFVEWMQRRKEHALQFDSIRIPRALRWCIYYFIILIIVAYSGIQQQFIYFQF
jgi:alginate O-acetyltransferase complex protein AlgI